MRNLIPTIFFIVILSNHNILIAQTTTTHIVESGESLSSIAIDFDTTTDILLELNNNLSATNLLQIGQEIITSDEVITSESPILPRKTISSTTSPISTVPTDTPINGLSQNTNVNSVTTTIVENASPQISNKSPIWLKRLTILEKSLTLLTLILILLTAFFYNKFRRVASYNKNLKSVNNQLEEQLETYEQRLSTLVNIEAKLEETVTANNDLRSLTIEHRNQIKAYEERFSTIVNIEAELNDVELKKSNIESDIKELQNDYKRKKETFNNLVREAAIYDEEIALAELGFYERHYDFGTSEEFKKQISFVRIEQKTMIQEKTAIVCDTEWTVEGSRIKGRTMINRAIKLTARAFNNECDAAIANVRWNNVDRMEARIEKAFTATNNMNASLNTEISHDYLNLKLQELRLTHEYLEKKQQEKEEQAEIRRLEREEESLKRETEKAIKEEEKLITLLDKARQEAKDEADTASEKEQTKLQEKINLLATQLAEAHAKSERALSMAQQTKAGHVYVISNIGSFGDNVYKIGMTRRLEPTDRVKELGDASVPFIFDTHALIFSDDAPALEKELHRTFEKKRVNLVNNRKEFFAVTLQEISNAVKKLSPDAEFIEEIEARDYKETQALIAQRENSIMAGDVMAKFPTEI